MHQRGVRDLFSVNNSSVISQLTNVISTQNKEAMESNRLCRQEIKQTINKEETKKDQTKKLHTSIIKMIRSVSAKSSSDESQAIPATCTHFLNSTNVGMAQYKLVHQFKELGFPYIGFTQGTAQALQWVFFNMPMPALQATSQFLPSTSKSHSWTPIKMITSFVN